MLGVRDLCRLSQRCSKGGMHCEALEQDMVDMFWALPKDEVLKAFEWGWQADYDIDCAAPKHFSTCLKMEKKVFIILVSPLTECSWLPASSCSGGLLNTTYVITTRSFRIKLYYSRGPAESLLAGS